MVEVQETENIASSLNEQPSGILKAFIARFFAENYIIPHLSEFRNLYPHIKVDLELGERMPDPSQEAIDLIFGLSMRGPENWVQKKLCDTRYAFCASPSYVNSYGFPKKPLDLLGHSYINHSMRKPANFVEFSNGESCAAYPSYYSQ